MQTFGTYLKTRSEQLGIKPTQLLNRLHQYDPTEFAAVDLAKICNWLDDRTGMPKPPRLKKIILALDDDPSAIITTLRFKDQHPWQGRLLEFVLSKVSRINDTPIIGSYLVQHSHRWHDMSQQFNAAYAQQLLEIDHELLPGEQYHASIEQLQAFAQMPGCTFWVLENANSQHRGHILTLPLKLDVFDAIASGQRFDVSITAQDLAQPGQPYGLCLYSYYAQNPRFAAELIATLFRLVASSNGLCRKLGGCTGVASGLSLTQLFGFRCSYGHPASADTLRPFTWKAKKLAYAIYAADTFELYAKLKPEVMAAFASDLNPG